MKTFQFYYKGNSRYAFFQADNQWYAMDRMPRHLLGFLCFPLNQIVHRVAYPITSEEYSELIEKTYKKNNLVIPASLIGGITVSLTTWARMNNIDLFHPFKTDLSTTEKSIVFVIGVMVSIAWLYWWYYSQKNS